MVPSIGLPPGVALLNPILSKMQSGNQTIKVAPNTAPGVPRLPATGMPLDTSAQIALQQAANNRINYLSNINRQQQNVERTYGQNIEDLNTQHPLDQEGLHANYGSRGMGFSSGAGIANSALEQRYSTAIDRLMAGHQQALDQLRANRRAYNNTYKLNKAMIQQAAAERLSAAAGSLGLGTPTLDPGTLASILQGGRR